MKSTLYLDNSIKKPFIISSKRNESLKFSISIVTDDQIEEIAKHTGRIHSSYEPLSCYLGFNEEYITQMVENSLLINQGLSIVARELETNKIVASLICEDVLSESHAEDIVDELTEQDQNDPQIDRFSKLINSFKYYAKLDTDKRVYFEPEEKEQYFHITFMSCEDEFTGHSIMTQLVKYMITEHPIIKNAQNIRVECTNIGSMIPCLKNGFVSEFVSEYKDYVDCETNENTYADLPAFLEKQKLPKTTQMEIMMYYKSKQQD